MPDVTNFTYKLDGRVIATNDAIISGREVRTIGGLNPASGYILIQIADGSTRSIGLEEPTDLRQMPQPEFLSFEGDRTFSLTVNERGWEWGAAKLSAADIYRYASIDEELELILDSAGDAVIPADGEVTLGGQGVERIRSREAKTVVIKVNGRPRTVPKKKLSYREVALLAYPDADFEKFKYTITYLKGVHGAEGDLVEGEKIEVKNGMVFNVRRSDKS
ncbi:multiubiquitin domain-containing protein [Mesorhizobium sp. M1148]|uniref:multiubiquitin domain-containing protein n=1 Tax=unclassified Mesorhizobium TaxID=325217 RepID=UPI00051936DA|nr:MULTISPECIES: multiubiquitin domain-containing protein [unclassified Mesorhizobium]WJI44720.1 multiubiquitin domain-containing protein [Mesorhizobium sp. C120A]